MPLGFHSPGLSARSDDGCGREYPPRADCVCVAARQALRDGEPRWSVAAVLPLSLLRLLVRPPSSCVRKWQGAVPVGPLADQAVQDRHD